MNKHDIATVKQAIKRHGDQFWNEERHGDSTNRELFDDILECINKAGYDLRLVNLK